VEWNPKYPLATTNVFHCPLIKARQLTKEGACKTALEVTLDLKVENQFGFVQIYIISNMGVSRYIRDTGCSKIHNNLGLKCLKHRCIFLVCLSCRNIACRMSPNDALGPNYVKYHFNGLLHSFAQFCPQFQEIYLFLQGTRITCEPGDAISLICSNQKHEVDILLNRLGYAKTADSFCTITLSSSAKKSAKVPDFFPPKFSLRELFMTCLDIRSVPKKVRRKSVYRHINLAAT
jgi:hypothetical protein